MIRQLHDYRVALTVVAGGHQLFWREQFHDTIGTNEALPLHPLLPLEQFFPLVRRWWHWLFHMVVVGQRHWWPIVLAVPSVLASVLASVVASGLASVFARVELQQFRTQMVFHGVTTFGACHATTVIGRIDTWCCCWWWWWLMMAKHNHTKRVSDIA